MYLLFLNFVFFDGTFADRILVLTTHAFVLTTFACLLEQLLRIAKEGEEDRAQSLS